MWYSYGSEEEDQETEKPVLAENRDGENQRATEDVNQRATEGVVFLRKRRRRRPGDREANRR
jgi:hypothetical protein